jgi:hypothetical protein
MQPAQWNRGIIEVQRSSAVTPRRSAVPQALPSMPRCDSRAPLGKPVVPEV